MRESTVWFIGFPPETLGRDGCRIRTGGVKPFRPKPVPRGFRHGHASRRRRSFGPLGALLRRETDMCHNTRPVSRGIKESVQARGKQYSGSASDRCIRSLFRPPQRRTRAPYPRLARSVDPPRAAAISPSLPFVHGCRHSLLVPITLSAVPATIRQAPAHVNAFPLPPDRNGIPLQSIHHTLLN